MAPNVPAIFDAHFGVPMIGAVLNAINIRLDAATIAFILDHGEARVLITDREFSGGENISSIEVEGVLYRHPAVLEAAVAARPDDTWGETPCAFVTLKDGAEASEDDIIAFCRDNMARFKVPKTVVFGPLPKTATGKIQKFVLRDKAREL